MSDFYSRCLTCGVDLPRGCRFCGEMCKERWYAKHDGEPVARVMTDEWPLVERESEAKAVPHNAGRRETMDGQEEGTARPTARSLYYPHKREFPF